MKSHLLTLLIKHGRLAAEQLVSPACNREYYIRSMQGIEMFWSTLHHGELPSEVPVIEPFEMRHYLLGGKI